MPSLQMTFGFLAKLARHNRGVAAVEFAIILPVMLIMYFGTYEVSSLIRAYLATNRAAQLMANLVAQEGSSGLTATDSADFCQAAQLAMSPFQTVTSPTKNATFKATIASVTYNATSGKVAFDWAAQDTTCGGGAGTFSSATTAANGLVPNKGDSVIITKIQYNYTGVVHFLLPAGYTIVQTAYQRPRTGTPIPHS